LEPVVEREPLPELASLLGEIYEVTGRTEAAERVYDLVRELQEQDANAGSDVDLERALFEADHGGDHKRAALLARAAYSRRPSIEAADALAWVLYQNGEIASAAVYIQEALRLRTRDALLHFHAGMIAYAAGDERMARHHLQEALAINPAFSIRYASQAEALLLELSERP